MKILVLGIIAALAFLLPVAMCVDEQPLLSNSNLNPTYHNWNKVTAVDGSMFELQPMSVWDGEAGRFLLWMYNYELTKTTNYEYTLDKFQCVEFCAQFIRDAYAAGYTHGLYLVIVGDCPEFPGGHALVGVASINPDNNRPSLELLDPQNGFAMNTVLLSGSIHTSITLMVPEHVTITDATHVTCDPAWEAVVNV